MQLGEQAGHGRPGEGRSRLAGEGRSERAGSTGAQQQARQARAAWALGARPGRAGWPRLCTRCTRPVFDSI